MSDNITFGNSIDNFNALYDASDHLRSFKIQKVEKPYTEYWDDSAYGVIFFTSYGWCGNDTSQTHHKMIVPSKITNLYKDGDVCFEDYIDLIGKSSRDIDDKFAQPIKNHFFLDMFFRAHPFYQSYYDYKQDKRIYEFVPSLVNNMKFDFEEEIKNEK